MRFNIPSILFKTKAEDLEKVSRESFLDILGENRFLRTISLVLALGLLGTTGALIWKSKDNTQVILVEQPMNVSYVEEGPQSAAQEKPDLPVGAATMVEEPQKPNELTKSVRTSLTGGTLSLVKEAVGIPTASQVEPSKGAYVSETNTIPEPLPPPKKEPGLWELLERLKADPQREILEKTFKSGRIEVAFKQASPEGIVSFEVLNQSGRAVYLPILQTVGSKSRVYLERRVVEDGSKSTGILKVDGLGEIGSLKMRFSAANLSPMDITLEVPTW